MSLHTLKLDATSTVLENGLKREHFADKSSWMVYRAIKAEDRARDLEGRVEGLKHRVAKTLESAEKFREEAKTSREYDERRKESRKAELVELLASMTAEEKAELLNS